MLVIINNNNNNVHVGYKQLGLGQISFPTPAVVSPAAFQELLGELQAAGNKQIKCTEDLLVQTFT